MELALASDVRTFTIPFQAKGIGNGDYSDDDVLGRLYKKMSPIPLVVNFVQNRIGGMEPKRLRLSETNREIALDTTPSALSDFKNWYFEKESDQAREAVERSDLGYTDPEVRAVQEVLRSIAGSSTVLRSRKPDGSMDRMLFLRKEGGFDIPFEALSGGEQAYFLLAVDLARRLLLEFPGSTLAEAPGFVCIDEIELHLHPAWQREILTSLMNLFPSCQFVVSTHSPQVIGSVAAQHIRLLSTDRNGHIHVTKPIASKGRDTNYVLEGVMDTPEQDPRVDGLFARFDQLIDEGAFNEADQVLDTLGQPRRRQVSQGGASAGEMQAPAKGTGVRGSAKGEEPEVLRGWKAGQRAARLRPRYDDLSRDAREATKKALFVEQTGQCVYCGRGIDIEKRNEHHVEHFRPRRYRDLELAYRNLFLSCGPHQADGGVQPTCGNEKGEWFGCRSQNERFCGL